MAASNPNPKPQLSSIPCIPPELVFDILLRLPPKDLMRFLCVCKALNATISAQGFIDAHHQRSIQTHSFRALLISSTNFNDVDCFLCPFYEDDNIGREAIKIEQPLKQTQENFSLVGFSRGLVCIHNSETDVALWNPSIQKFKKIPFPPSELKPVKKKESLISVYGFGYDSANDDYKVVRFLQFINTFTHKVRTEVKVYSLKSNSWKRIQNLPCDDLSFSPGVECLNSALHWPINDINQYKILTLNLVSEKYHEFPTPVVTDRYSPPSLTVLQGCLCFLNMYSLTQTDVWVMKVYGVAKSWVMLFSIRFGAVPPSFECCFPLAFSKSGEMVLLENWIFEPPEIVENDFEKLIWYDIEKRRYTGVKIDGVPEQFCTTICEGNLRLLDGDPVIVQRQQQVPSTSNKRKFQAVKGISIC